MSAASKYLTLGIENDVFGVPVQYVQEILDMCPISGLPYAPDYLVGMIDVRGRGVPVLNLRAKLGLSSVPTTTNTRILVLNLPSGYRGLTLGVIADRVIEVTELDESELQAPPEIGVRWRSDYIVGIGRRGPSFVVVFDIPKLFTTEDVPLLMASASEVSA